MMITPKQFKLFKFVQASDPSPTYAEIATHMGMADPKTAYEMVTRMVNKNLLERSPIKNRTIRVVME